MTVHDQIVQAWMQGVLVGAISILILTGTVMCVWAAIDRRRAGRAADADRQVWKFDQDSFNVDVVDVVSEAERILERRP